ncbi:ABC transporter ATP-binding protein [Undibacter mobilis]|uniref:ABC transporter ATP-binding protein n=1 Tax=Undibacter mobilis TaxID=2292256 RepID=A0A371BDC2_9BRAD|nr:ABC transporter ATP-binding protein [Undibacter mobilis]RDV05606.1 ABC transporter ATP-binding protein [Undibacter mobilis]
MTANGAAGEKPVIKIEGVAKSFGGVPAVSGISLDIARGEFFCLVGASGSGKTTLLRLIAGFEAPDSGHILIDGEDMSSRPPYARPVNMMFQSYALFPHLTVADNVAFGLEEERRPRAEIRERVAAALDMFEMGTFGARKPHQLSGGQRQRVALARALVKNPKILLLDEPLAALDKKLRERAQLELVALRERVGITFVMVTHDQEEAMSMASRIALMRDGAICQVGSPRELYDAPQSRFAADFFGTANLFDNAGPGNGTVMVRPEQVMLSKAPPDRPDALSGTLGNVVFLGNASVCYVTLNGGKIVQARLSPADMARFGALAAGDRVYVSWEPSAARVLTS